MVKHQKRKKKKKVAGKKKKTLNESEREKDFSGKRKNKSRIINWIGKIIEYLMLDVL